MTSFPPSDNARAGSVDAVLGIEEPNTEKLFHDRIELDINLRVRGARRKIDNQRERPRGERWVELAGGKKAPSRRSWWQSCAMSRMFPLI